jgi:hypothetical protein
MTVARKSKTKHPPTDKEMSEFTEKLFGKQDKCNIQVEDHMWSNEYVVNLKNNHEIELNKAYALLWEERKKHDDFKKRLELFINISTEHFDKAVEGLKDFLYES